MAQIIKRGKSYLVRVFVERDASGKPRFINKTIRGTKKDAEQWAKRVELELSTGTYTEPTRQFVKDYLSSWLKAHATAVRERTIDGYRGLVEQYLIPSIGDIALSHLTATDISAVYSGMTERGLSARTVRYTHSVLRKALNDAVRDRLLTRNVATLARLPRKERKEVRPLNRDEARRFLNAAASDRWHALWFVLLGCGLRPSEALGLRWSDFDGERLRIQRTLVHGSTGRAWRFEEPKTAKSRRLVPLPASTLAALRTHKARQAAERLRAGSEYADLDLVFASSRGVPPDFACLRRRFVKICAEAECPKIRLYDLRHTCATLMLAADVHPKVVSEILGHHSIVMTLDTYSHVLPGMGESAAERLHQLLGATGS